MTGPSVAMATSFKSTPKEVIGKGDKGLRGHKIAANTQLLPGHCR
jgi:hypothetical protein